MFWKTIVKHVILLFNRIIFELVNLYRGRVNYLQNKISCLIPLKPFMQFTKRTPLGESTVQNGRMKEGHFDKNDSLSIGLFHVFCVLKRNNL